MTLHTVSKVRTRHLLTAKAEGEKISMLTAYDAMTAQIFDNAGIDMLLVGDSAANVVYGRETTLSLTLDEMITMARAVAQASKRAFVVADMPFSTSEVSPADAVRHAVRLMQESGVSAVKIEGGVQRAQTVKAIVDAGIPVMGHIGFMPQSVHAHGGFTIQGRKDQLDQLVEDARAIEAAGAFSLVVEMVDAAAATAVTQALDIPVIGIGAGNSTDGQVLVWQDAFGLGTNAPSFARQYANLHEVLTEATAAYIAEVRDGSFPSEEETFRS